MSAAKVVRLKAHCEFPISTEQLAELVAAHREATRLLREARNAMRSYDQSVKDLAAPLLAEFLSGMQIQLNQIDEWQAEISNVAFGNPQPILQCSINETAIAEWVKVAQ